MPREPESPHAVTAAPPDSRGAGALLPQRPLWLWLLLIAVAAGALYLLGTVNYLLFHVLVELGGIVLAAAVFTIGWNVRRLTSSPFFLILATGFLATGLLDLLHTLSYKGMGVLPVADSNVPTQLWIAARLLQAASFLLAALSLGRPRRLAAWGWLTAFVGAALLLLLAIWPLQIFPRCFSEGAGLTPFKRLSEYLIIAMFAAAALLLWVRRSHLGPRLSGLLVLALLFSIVSEWSFTLYSDPYGLANFVGHLGKFTAMVLVYLALVEGTLRTPYSTLFRELSELNRDLDAELGRRQRSEAYLREVNREIAVLYRTARFLHTTLRLDPLCHLVLSLAASAEGGSFRRAMLFTANPRNGVLQGMLGIDRESAALVLPPAAEPDGWDEPRLDPAVCAAQRESACNQVVVRQRLALVAADNPLAKACLERRLVLVEALSAEWPGARNLAEALGLDTCACAPLGERDEPFGVLLVDFAATDPAPPAERLRFLELFARQATAALENARLLHRLESAHRELREVQEQLIQGEKLAVLGEMAAQLAHELRNPLVSVGGFARRLTRLDPGDQRVAEYGAIIAREVRRLEEMLDNILTFSRKQPVNWEPCDLNVLLGEALELEAELRLSRGIALVLEIVAPLPEMVGDCRQLRQVLLNLLSNARQAMPRGGTLILRAESCTLRGDEAVSIEVEDTGGGIPAEIMRNIFNPFFSTHPQGTGIGLSLSHRIIELHHGEIEVLNGVAGARFIVRLPLHPPAIAP